MLQFLNILDGSRIGGLYPLSCERQFVKSEKLVIEGKNYRFVERLVTYYQDLEGGKVIVNMYVKEM